MHLLERAVLRRTVHRHLAALELLRAGVGEVRRAGPARRYSYGVNRYAVDTVWLQATSLVPADVDHRRADQRGAGDVVLAGDRQVLLGEAVAAAPREVRVAEQHALAGRGGVAADGGRVGAERRLRVAPEPGQQRVPVDRRPAVGTSGRPGSSGDGGSASTISLTKHPVEASRLAR